MARISSLHTSEKQRSNPIISLQNRSRHVSLFAAILLAMPLFAQVVSGQHQQEAGTRTIPREEETVQIFSPPSSAFNKIDFHGVTIPFSKLLKSTEMVQTSGGLGLGAGETLEESSSSSPETSSSHRGSSRNGVSRVNLSIYPPKDVTPDVNSPQVKAWVAEIDWSKVPNIPVATSLPDVIHFPKCPPMNGLDRSTCWWSCAGCIAPDDIVACPSQDAWGLTYDDGPSLATKDMIAYLNSQGLTATFFIVGSRVLEHADILKNEIAQGHHIGMHTWSHAGLTTLTNEQIVAEIKWTEKIIRDVTGLTMKYVRPPYGDTDNRVREILRQMGYTTVIWSKGWDTNDWRMLQNQIQPAEVVQNFNNALGNKSSIQSASGAPGGPITLEHDLTDATINMSMKLIPMAQSSGLKPMSLAACLNDQTPYQHGSKLGPGGAKEKINNGEGSTNYMGMPGMEEQDFKPSSKKKGVSKVPTSKTGSGSVVKPKSYSIVASVMLGGYATLAWLGIV